MAQDGNNSIATLIRLAADGELSDQQEAILRAHLEAHPEDRARIEFERKLRDACGCACSTDCCAPETLRQKVLSCCSGAAASDDADLADRLTRRAAETRDRGFWAGRAVARYGALAAVIALIGLVSFMVGRATLPVGPDVEPRIRTVGEKIAYFVRAEHNRCADAPNVGPKFTIHDSSKLPEEFSSIVGQSVSLGCILEAEDEGLHFIDAGPCYPPGGDALHIRFTVDNPEASPISLWIQKDDGSLPIDDGITYTQGEGCDCVRFWRVDGIRYVLVCSEPESAPIASVALHSPTTTRPF